jgi:hypothetical protein
MKKFPAFALSVALLLSMTACSSATPSEERLTTEVTAEVTPSPAPTTAPTTLDEDDSVLESLSSNATIEETVLVDEADVKITATELVYSDYEVKLRLTIENNTDQDLSFRSGTMAYCCNSINGYMIDDGYLNADVLAGKKSNETISFDIDELALLGITEITDITVGFDIENDDYDTYLQTGPVQLKTSLYDSQANSSDSYFDAFTGNSALANLYDYSIVYSAQDELYNQGGIRICSEVLVENSDGDLALMLEVENTSQDFLYTSIGDIFINNLCVYPYSWTTDSLNPDSRRIINLSLDYIVDDTYWDAFGITDITDIAFSFSIQDSDYDDLYSEQLCQVSMENISASVDTSGTTLYDENGLQIISKGLYPDASSYSDDIHLLLLLKNDSSEPQLVDVGRKTVSVNGYMTDFWCSDIQVDAGKFSILDVKLRSNSLEESGIEQLSDITDMELTFEIETTSYDTIDEPTVSLTF